VIDLTLPWIYLSTVAIDLHATRIANKKRPALGASLRRERVVCRQRWDQLGAWIPALSSSL
jgi:hypothetical protein